MTEEINKMNQDLLQDENNRYYAFVNLALILAAVTGIELVLVYLPFPRPIIFTILISLSLFKFIGVVAWFMHLIFLLGGDAVAPPEIPGR